MGFARSETWRLSCEAYYRTKNPHIETTHVFVDQHYPKNERDNRRELASICVDHGLWWLDAGRNLGGTEGINWVMRELSMRDDDILIGYDPDSNPISPGWDGALVHALQKDSGLVWTSLMSHRSQPELIARGYSKKQLDHLEVWVTHKPVVNSICAWRVGWLRKIGGLSQDSKFYGGLEAGIFTRLAGSGKQWGFLPGWWEDDAIRDSQDREYLWYKWKHAHLREWAGDFRSYLEAGCPPPSDSAPARLP